MSSDDGGQAHGGGKLSPQDRAQFERRVSELNQKLGKVRAGREAGAKADSDAAESGRSMGQGFRMATELVAAVLVGGLIGFGLDRLFGTTPWLFLLFFLLGFAAGVLNVIRASNRMQAEAKRRPGGIGHAVPDDVDD